MKLFVVLALITLAASPLEAERHLEKGYRYKYEYYTHHLSTIENDGNRHSGMAFSSNIIIDVFSDSHSQFELHNVVTDCMHEDIEQVDEATLPWEFEPVKEPLKTHLEKPFSVVWKNGKVESLFGDPNEPHESWNIKKGIAQLFQMNYECLGLPGPYSSNSHSHPSYSRNQLSDGSSDSDSEAINCMEGCIYGDCNFLYVLESNPSPENPNSDCLNVTKYVDYSECDDAPIWIRTSHAPNECTDCEADDEEPFTTTAKINYDIKKTGNSLTIECIETEARSLFKPFSTNSDHFSVNHSQILTLSSKIKIGLPRTEKQPYSSTHSTLKYVFPTAHRANPNGITLSLKKGQVPFFYEGKEDVVPKSIKLLNETAREMLYESMASVKVKETPLKLYKLVSNIRLMNSTEIKEFYDGGCYPNMHNPIADITRQICVDSLVSSGNHPAIVCLKLLIETGQIVGEQAVQAVQAIPTNLVEPSNAIVEEIWSFAHSPVARANPQLRITAYLTFAIIVSKACDGPEDDNPSLPNAPHYNEFCPNDIEKKYVYMLGNELKTAQEKNETMFLLRALGLTESPYAVEIIGPYASGDAAEDEVVQKCALHSLRTIAKFAPDEASDIAENEFYDTDNERGVRIAAFRVMMSSQPDFSDVQQIVAWYLKEPSDDVKGYMLSFFDSISNATHYCLKDMANNADQMMPFFDEDDYNGIQSSNVWETSQIFDELGISTQTYCSWTASNSTFFPEHIQCRMNNTIAGYSFKPMMGALNLNGLNAVINRALGPIGAFRDISSLEDLFRPEDEIPDDHKTDINRKLDLRTRRQEPFELSAFLKIGDNQARFMSFDHNSIVEFLRDKKRNPFNLEDLEKGIKVEYLKTYLPYDVQMQTPAIGGVPIIFSVRTPTIVNIVGKIRAVLQPSPSGKHPGLPGAILFEADLRPSISNAVRVSAGCYSPFQNEVQVVSALRSTYLAVPLSTSVEVSLRQGQIKVAIKPSMTYSKGSVGSQQRVFHMSVNQTSTHCSLKNLDTLCESNPIHVREPEENEIDLSKNCLGLPLVLKSESEHDWNDAGSFKDWYDEYDSLITFLSVHWATPEFAARCYDLYLTGHNPEDKEIQFAVEWDYLPPPVKDMVFKSIRNARGIWPLISGFADLPMKCAPQDKYPKSRSKPWYLGLWDKAAKLAPHYDKELSHTLQGFDNYYGEILSPFHNQQRSSGYQEQSPWAFDGTEDTEGSGYSPKSSYSYTSKTEDSLIVRKVSRDNEVSVLNVKMSAVAKGLSSKLVTKVKMTRNYAKLTDNVEVVVDATNIPIFSASQVQICSTCDIKYPEMPCDYHRLMTPNPKLAIQAHAKVNWGLQKCSPSNEISANVIFKKSGEQIREEEFKNKWYFVQCQRDVLEGKKFTDACEEAQMKFSTLNKMEAQVQFTKLPNLVKNLSSFADNYLKATYYKQMSNNPVGVNNGERSLKVVAILRDEVPSLDLKLFKPYENTFFHKIYLPVVYPISTQDSILDQIYDDFTNDMATPNCKVMGKHINTFDNTTYMYKMPRNCKHVVTKDCSPEDLFAVVVTDKGNGRKSLDVALLSHRFNITPEERYSGKFKVIADGQYLEPSDDVVLVISSNDPMTGRKVLAMLLTTGPELHLIAPMHGLAIKTDGEDVYITLSGLWGNRVCGLSGQYDGESGYDDDFIDPQQCIRPDPFSFGLSYALSGPACTLPRPPNPNKMCEDDSPAASPYSRAWTSEWQWQ